MYIEPASTKIILYEFSSISLDELSTATILS